MYTSVRSGAIKNRESLYPLYKPTMKFTTASKSSKNPPLVDKKPVSGKDKGKKVSQYD